MEPARGSSRPSAPVSPTRWDFTCWKLYSHTTQVNRCLKEVVEIERGHKVLVVDVEQAEEVRQYVENSHFSSS